MEQSAMAREERRSSQAAAQLPETSDMRADQYEKNLKWKKAHRGGGKAGPQQMWVNIIAVTDFGPKGENLLALKLGLMIDVRVGKQRCCISRSLLADGCSWGDSMQFDLRGDANLLHIILRDANADAEDEDAVLGQ